MPTQPDPERKPRLTKELLSPSPVRNLSSKAGVSLSTGLYVLPYPMPELGLGFRLRLGLKASAKASHNREVQEQAYA